MKVSRTTDKLTAAVSIEKQDLGTTFTAFEPPVEWGEVTDGLVDKIEILGVSNWKVNK